MKKQFIYKGQTYSEGEEVLMKTTYGKPGTCVTRITNLIRRDRSRSWIFHLKSKHCDWFCEVYDDGRTSSDFPIVFEKVNQTIEIESIF